MLKKIVKKYFLQIIHTIILITMICFIYIYVDKLYILFSDPILLKELILSYEPYSLLVFILLQIFQVVIFVIPGEVVQIVGGYVYGAIGGAIVSLIGIAVGSTITFSLANILGKKHVLKLVSKKHSMFIDKIIEYGRNKRIIFSLHLTPGIPKDILGYICGITNVKFIDFIIYSTLGRIPGIMLSTLFGANIVDKNYITIGIIIASTLLLVIISALKGEQLMNKLLKRR